MRTAGGEFGIESMAAACLNGAREQAAYVLHARSASAALFVARERSRVDLFTACVSRTLEESTFGVSPEPHGLTAGGPNGRRWDGRPPQSVRWREGARGRVLVGLGTRTMKFFRFFAHLALHLQPIGWRGAARPTRDGETSRPRAGLRVLRSSARAAARVRMAIAAATMVPSSCAHGGLLRQRCAAAHGCSNCCWCQMMSCVKQKWGQTSSA